MRTSSAYVATPPSAGQPIRGITGDTQAVGFNPYRRFRARPIDYALVAACMIVAIALVVWALIG